jgi:phage gp36-like protein
MPITATSITTGPAAGYYATEQDLRDTFGSQSIDRWSQLDPTLTILDDSRIQRALTYADAEINLMLQGSAYAVPLVLAGGAEVPAAWAATIAGIWLFRSKGGQADAATVSRYDTMLMGVYNALRRVVAGTLRLNAALRRWPSPTGPEAVDCNQ